MTPEWRFSSTLTAASGVRRTAWVLPDALAADDFSPYGGPYYFFCTMTEAAWRRAACPGPQLALGGVRPNFADTTVADAGHLQRDRQQAGAEPHRVWRTAVQALHTQAGRIVSYQDPRAVRFAVRYDF